MFPLAIAAVLPAAIVTSALFLRTPSIGAYGATVYFALFWLYACAAAAVFAMPLFMLVPRLRRPPAWIATVWGAAIPWAIVSVLSKAAYVPQTSAWWFTVSGALTGLVYALLVRRVREPGSD